MAGIPDADGIVRNNRVQVGLSDREFTVVRRLSELLGRSMSKVVGGLVTENVELWEELTDELEAARRVETDGGPSDLAKERMRRKLEEQEQQLLEALAQAQRALRAAGGKPQEERKVS